MRSRTWFPIGSLALFCGLTLGGCNSTTESHTNGSSVAFGASAQQPAIDGSHWSLTGSRIIGCCCNTPCPCRMNYKPTQCHGCDAITAVHVTKGRIGDVDMSGIDYIIAGRFFGEDETTNWNYAYVSDKATDAQVAALGAMLEAGAKAVGEKMKYLAGEPKGMRKVPIEWRQSADGREWSVKIPDILDLQTRSIILPGRTKPVASSGIFDDFGDKFIHADCIKHQYNDPSIGYSWSLDGRQCNQADFTITSEQVARGGVTWGCWSAHADLGDTNKTQYQEKSIGHN